ncbi:hypothetical protein Hanom_Chr12g01107151 [Helianthus anomalus]
MNITKRSEVTLKKMYKGNKFKYIGPSVTAVSVRKSLISISRLMGLSLTYFVA